MLRRTLLASLIAGAVLTTAVVAVSAHEKDDKDYHHKDFRESPLGRLMSGVIGRLMVLKSEVNLTDEQHEQIHKIFKEHREEICKEAQGVWTKRNALRDAVLKGAGNESEIRDAANALGKQIGDAAMLAAKIRDEVDPVLTAEQKQAVQKFMTDNDEAVGKFFKKMGKDD
jgi:Spy/CpxP family protein refolding chaperone